MRVEGSMDGSADLGLRLRCGGDETRPRGWVGFVCFVPSGREENGESIFVWARFAGAPSMVGVCCLGRVSPETRSLVTGFLLMFRTLPCHHDFGGQSSSVSPS